MMPPPSPLSHSLPSRSLPSHSLSPSRSHFPCSMLSASQNSSISTPDEPPTAVQQRSEQRSEQQRSEAFAQQVRGSSHDINNALTIVVGYAQLLESQPDLPPHLLRQVQALLHEATRAVGQVDHLLHLSSWNQEHAEAALQTAPQMVQPTQTETKAEIEVAQMAGGAEILVVDDEEPIITLISEILATDGHRVTPAFNGAEAIAWTEMRDFDLIISDVRMPAVGGPAFFEILQNSRPDLLARVVFVTGDTVSGSTRQFLQSANRPVLAKPFDPERLRTMVEELLAQN